MTSVSVFSVLCTKPTRVWMTVVGVQSTVYYVSEGVSDFSQCVQCTVYKASQGLDDRS